MKEVCTCGNPPHGTMVSCGSCNEEFHPECTDSGALDGEWHCPICGFQGTGGMTSHGASGVKAVEQTTENSADHGETLDIVKPLASDQAPDSAAVSSTAVTTGDNGDCVGRKRKDSTSSKTEPTKRRKSSTSKKPQVPQKLAVVKQNELDSRIRESVRTNLKQAMQGKISTRSDSEAVGEESIQEKAIEIELMLYELCGSADSKYKNKFRSILFNMKDASNEWLVQSLLSGELTAREMVRMETQALASKTLNAWREQEKQNLAESVIKRQGNEDDETRRLFRSVLSERTASAAETNKDAAFSGITDSGAAFREAERMRGSMVDETDQQPTISKVYDEPSKNIEVLEGYANMDETSLQDSEQKQAEFVNEPQTSNVIIDGLDDGRMKWTVRYGIDVDRADGLVPKVLYISKRVKRKSALDHLRRVRRLDLCNLAVLTLHIPATREDFLAYNEVLGYLQSRNSVGIAKAEHPDVHELLILPSPAEEDQVPDVFEDMSVYKKPGTDLLLFVILFKKLLAPNGHSTHRQPAPATVVEHPVKKSINTRTEVSSSGPDDMYDPTDHTLPERISRPDPSAPAVATAAAAQAIDFAKLASAVQRFKNAPGSGAATDSAVHVPSPTTAPAPAPAAPTGLQYNPEAVKAALARLKSMNGDGGGGQ
eukprot:Clim_evm93s243 gene=Clim_evmTU93s243